MNIRIYAPCHGRTDCRAVEIGDVTLGFSYNTLITISSPRVQARLANHWSTTTGKHFSGLGFGNRKDDRIVPDAEFDRLVREELLGLGLRQITDKVLHGLDRVAA